MAYEKYWRVTGELKSLAGKGRDNMTEQDKVKWEEHTASLRSIPLSERPYASSYAQIEHRQSLPVRREAYRNHETFHHEAREVERVREKIQPRHKRKEKTLSREQKTYNPLGFFGHRF